MDTPEGDRESAQAKSRYINLDGRGSGARFAYAQSGSKNSFRSDARSVVGANECRLRL